VFFTRDQLLDAVWGTDRFVTPRSVDVYVRRLREKSKAIPRIPSTEKPSAAPGTCSKLVRHNLFWKLAFTFLALLLSVLVAVDFFAERALREEYTRTTLGQLESIARLLKRSHRRSPQCHHPALTIVRPWTNGSAKWPRVVSASP